MNFLRIGWRDIKSIFNNRFIRVAVTAIIIVPLLYCLLYLAAFWDPYSRLNELPVAIVNLDKGSTKDGKDVNYGNDLVKNLKENKTLKWVFTDKADAQSGVEGKKFYAEFIIPEDFSKKALSAKDGKPEQPKITFTANEKRNFLAAQINGKVEVQLKAEISKNITEEYTKVTFDSLYDVKDGFTKASDGSKTLYNGMNDAKDGSNKLADGINQLGSKVPALSKGVSDLFNGSSALTKGLNDANSGLGQLNTGLNTTAKDASGNPTGLKAGTTALYNGIQTLNTSLSTTAKDAKGNPLGLKAGVDALATGIGTLNAGISTTAVDPTTHLPLGLKSGADAIAAGVSDLNTGINTTAVDASGKPVGLVAGTSVLVQSIKNVNISLNVANMDTVHNVQLPSIKAMAGKVTVDAASIQAILADTTKSDSDKVAAISTVTSGLLFDAGTNKALVEGLASQVNAGIPSADAYQAGVNNLASKVSTQLVPGTKGLQAGVNQIAGAVSTQVLPGIQGIQSGVNQLTGAVSTQLSPAALKIQNGTAQVSDAIGNQVLPGIQQLSNGSGQLNAGLKTMNDGMPTLADGVTQLTSGSSELYSGMTKLTDGSKELNDKLKDGSDNINKSLVNDSSTMSKFVATPIEITEAPFDAVKNYGTGFTPYFIPLALWVGAMLMFFVITEKVDDDINASTISVVLGKYITYAFIGTIQAVLASTVVLMLGLHPKNMLLYFLFNIFMSYVFIAIMQCLVFLLGLVGRMLGIVLLIFQLTTCAGTFPLELVPSFFKVLNPIAPFTYCVSGLRETIAGADYSVLGHDVLVLFIVFIVFMTISVLFKGHADKVKNKVQEMNNMAM